jgi:cytochrome c biogenesis protein
LPKKNPLLSFFASVKLAIVLLVLIAAASIVGTLIPQQEAAGPFIARLSPGVARFMQGLQLFDLFHSVWFMILMALLAVNLTVCSLDRFPRAWRRFRQKGEPERADLFDDLPSDQTVFTEAPLADEADRLAALLKKKTGPVERRDAGGRTWLLAQKGALSHFGVYIVHAGVLVMMAGVIIGLLYGFEGAMNIPEGESSSAVTLRGGRGVKPLDFAVRCDRFFMDSYETGAPKTYRSDLTFLQDGREAHTASVLVNHPVSFAGMRFYQSSYGSLPVGEPVITVRLADRKIMDVKIAVGLTFDLPDHEATVQMLRVEDNLMGMGPAVKLGIDAPAGAVQLWVFAAIEQIAAANPGLLQQVPLFNPGAFTPYVFSLSLPERRPYTGLQVARDPGLPLVAAGAAFMMIGLMMVFFWSHRQIRVRLEAAGDKTRISVAGSSSRDAVGLNREIRNWVQAIESGRRAAP